MNDTTTTAPDRHIVLAAIARDYSQDRWRRTFVLPAQGNDLVLPPRSVERRVLIAHQIERAPWKFVEEYSLESLLSNVYRTRRFNLIGSAQEYAEPTIGTKTMRIGFVPIEHDDYVRMQVRTAPEYKTRKILLDWEKDLEKKGALTVATT
jgi:hypothetical protein